VTLTKKTEEMPEEVVKVEEEENGGPTKRVSKDDKTKIDRLYDRALAFIKRKEPKTAVKTLVQALAINPDCIDAQKELGKLYLDQKMWGKAAAVYKYLSVKSEDPVDYSHLGLALYNAGEFEESAAAYQEAITRDPKRPQRYVSLGHVYMDLDKLPLALIAFNKALEMDPENVDYILLVADIQMKLKNFAEARGLLDKAVELAPMGKIARRMLKEIEEAEKAVGESGGQGLPPVEG